MTDASYCANLVKMSAPGTMDEFGQSHAPKDMVMDFQVPTIPSGGTARDMGSLALFLVANWFVNGEVVLIDGGVSSLILKMYYRQNPQFYTISDSSQASLVVVIIQVHSCGEFFYYLKT